MKPLGDRFGASWRPFWGLLGASWGLLGRLWGLLARLTPMEAALGASLGRVGALLERFEAVLGPSWEPLGPSRGDLVGLLCRPGALEVRQGDKADILQKPIANRWILLL